MTVLYIPIIPQWQGLPSRGEQLADQDATAGRKVGQQRNSPVAERNHHCVDSIKTKTMARNYHPKDDGKIEETGLCQGGMMGYERSIRTTVRAGPI